MANRATRYGTTYVPAYRMALRWEEIQKNISDEQAAYKEAQLVAQSERDRLNQLTEALALEGASPDTLAAYLAAVRADEAAAIAARAAAGRSVTDKQKGLGAIVDKISGGVPTANQVEEFIGALKSGPRLSDTELSRLMTAAKLTPTEQNRAVKANAARPAGGAGGPPAPSRQAVEGFLLTQMTSPSAAVDPAMQGQVEARRTAKSESLPTLSQDQVLNAYLRALESGRGGDVAARFTAALGAQLPADADPGAALAEAERIYNQVRDEGSFVRKDARLFNDGWLQTADALREANELAERIKPGYTDPAREAARREIVARGLNPDDPFLKYHGTRQYNYFHEARKQYMAAGGVVEPKTPAQEKMVEFLRLWEQRNPGKKIDLKAVEREFGKTHKGEDLVSLIGFGMAYTTPAKPEGARPSTATKEQLAEIDRNREAARAESERIEQELATEIDMLTAQAGAKAAIRPVRPGAAVPVSPELPGIPEGPRTGATGRPAGALGAAFAGQVESAGQEAATRKVMQALREGGDLRTNVMRLRALGYTNEQIRALVAATPRPVSGSAEDTIRRVTMGAEDIGRGMFVDWSDPKRPIYKRNPDGTITGPDGKKISSKRAMAALSVVERGDTPENRAALEKIKAQAQKPVGGGGTGGARNVDLTNPELVDRSMESPAWEADESPTAKDPYARLPEESAADYAKRIRGMR